MTDSHKVEIFWSKVKKTETCWLWTGSFVSGGYGATRISGLGGMAHRISWTLANGPIPPGMEVRHACDVRACVRPEHLVLGTHAENMADASERDRWRRGSRAERSTPLARWILHASKFSLIGFAKHVGVTTSAISRICSGQTVPNVRLAVRIIEATGGSVTLEQLAFPFGRP